jgi:hypothetical protein
MRIDCLPYVCPGRYGVAGTKVQVEKDTILLTLFTLVFRDACNFGRNRFTMGEEFIQRQCRGQIELHLYK